ncbi:hypothetical protein KJ596_01520 [Patescibacteria group bacterium]|nr:hypothetical protein [Patescibacteria group bacterium]MBU1868083.1 hypothetical protein [Patescibacteria group bacterium]
MLAGEEQSPAIMWTRGPVLHEKKYDRFREIATALQQVIGVSAPIEEFWVSSGSFNGLSPHDIPGRQWAIVTLSEHDKPEIAAHEIAHQILEGVVAGMPRQGVILEGLCDLAALEALGVIKGSNPAEIIRQRADRYSRIQISPEQEALLDESADLTTVDFPPTNESLGHFIGRRFAYVAMAGSPDIPLAHLLHCVIAKPPSKEQLLDPQSYIDIVRSHPWTNKSIEPIETKFRDPPERLI